MPHSPSPRIISSQVSLSQRLPFLASHSQLRLGFSSENWVSQKNKDKTNKRNYSSARKLIIVSIAASESVSAPICSLNFLLNGFKNTFSLKAGLRCLQTVCESGLSMRVWWNELLPTANGARKITLAQIRLSTSMWPKMEIYACAGGDEMLESCEYTRRVQSQSSLTHIINEAHFEDQRP